MPESLIKAASARFPDMSWRRGGPLTIDEEIAMKKAQLAALTAPLDTSTASGNEPFTSAPPVKLKTDWKGLLSSGLTGAAYGIQANVGRAIPGQEWRQGLLRGITGMGMMAAGREKMKMETAERLQKTQDAKELAAYKQSLKSAEPGWEEKFPRIEAGKMERVIAAAGFAEEKARTARKESDSGMTKAQLSALRTTAYKQAFDEISKSGEDVIPALVIPRYHQIYNLLLAPKSDWGNVPAPGSKK